MERELRYAEALRVYQQCAERDTANLDAALSLADVASTLGLADVAERTYRRILLRDTANFYARYRLARLYASQENYRRAIAEYERLTSPTPPLPVRSSENSSATAMHRLIRPTSRRFIITSPLPRTLRTRQSPIRWRSPSFPSAAPI